jgi:hypothetical protein
LERSAALAQAVVQTRPRQERCGRQETAATAVLLSPVLGRPILAVAEAPAMEAVVDLVLVVESRMEVDCTGSSPRLKLTSQDPTLARTHFLDRNFIHPLVVVHAQHSI